MLAKLVRADPAIMAAPLITTIVDALSLVLYFTIASRLLHLCGYTAGKAGGHGLRRAPPFPALPPLRIG